MPVHVVSSRGSQCIRTMEEVASDSLLVSRLHRVGRARRGCVAALCSLFLLAKQGVLTEAQSRGLAEAARREMMRRAQAWPCSNGIIWQSSEDS